MLVVFYCYFVRPLWPDSGRVLSSHESYLKTLSPPHVLVSHPEPVQMGQSSVLHQLPFLALQRKLQPKMFAVRITFFVAMNASGTCNLNIWALTSNGHFLNISSSWPPLLPLGITQCCEPSNVVLQGWTTPVQPCNTTFVCVVLARSYKHVCSACFSQMAEDSLSLELWM